MRIPDYKKRAAHAAAEWRRLQEEKKSDPKEAKEIIIEQNNSKKESTVEMSITDLIDELTVPKATVKGIKVIKKSKFRDTA